MISYGKTRYKLKNFLLSKNTCEQIQIPEENIDISKTKKRSSMLLRKKSGIKLNLIYNSEYVYDINPMHEMMISVIGSNDKKCYGVYGRKKYDKTTTLNTYNYDDNIIDITIPNFTEYILKIVNINPALEYYYTLDHVKLNNKNLIIAHPTKIYCYENITIGGRWVNNPKGTFLAISSSKHNTNSIELHMKKWKIIVNTDINERDNAIDDSIDLNHIIIFKIRINIS